jgi:hypothetical protein
VEGQVLRFTPEEWSSAWSGQPKRLLVALPGQPVMSQQVAMRVELAGHIFQATVLGRVVGLRGTGAQARAEVEPDAASLAAIDRIDAAARGKTVSFRSRPRRWLAKLPVALLSRGGALMMVTGNVSPGGCSLRWSGAPPAVNQVVRLRFGMGPRAVELDGTIRWVRTSAGTTVGIRFCDPRAAALLGPTLAAVERTQPPTV